MHIEERGNFVDKRENGKLFTNKAKSVRAFAADSLAEWHASTKKKTKDQSEAVSSY